MYTYIIIIIIDGYYFKWFLVLIFIYILSLNKLSLSTAEMQIYRISSVYAMFWTDLSGCHFLSLFDIALFNKFSFLMFVTIYWLTESPF